MIVFVSHSVRNLLRFGSELSILLRVWILFYILGINNTFAGFLLERMPKYSNGIEEFAFHHEYPGRTNQFPSDYYVGSVQANAILLWRSINPAAFSDTIPTELTTNLSAHLVARYEKSYWVLNVFKGYDRKVWEDTDRSDELNNEIEKEYISGLGIVSKYLLNLGLEHSDLAITPSLLSDSYTNLTTGMAINYNITETNISGGPTLIVASVQALDNHIRPVKWRFTIDYIADSHGDRPSVITRYVTRTDEAEHLADRIVITKLIPAQKSLPREHFIRTAYSTPRNYFQPSMTYYLASNTLVGYDAKSNSVVRLRADDPRLLTSFQRKKLLIGYWISAAFIALCAVGVFVWTRRKGSN